jgi:hemerythrin-like metal-binding protein
MTWSSDMSVHIKSIDMQHQRLINQINKLHAAMSTDAEKQVIAPLLGELLASAAAHFAYEEKLMSDNRYPKFTEHKLEHDALAAKAKELARDLGSGKRLGSAELMTFMKEWLSRHIMTIDKSYGTFLADRGVR